MSIISAVCAEVDLDIVRKAIQRAKADAKKQCSAGEFVKVEAALAYVLKECEEKISE
jgi:hypothetical protein